MYKVYNTSRDEYTECDAIETIIYRNGKYIPAERDVADGFNAMTIHQKRDKSEYYDITPFVYEGHTLAGTEDVGTFEWIKDDSEEKK